MDDVMVGQAAYVFLLAAGINIVAAAFYAIFASGELQHWATAHKADNIERYGKRFTEHLYQIYSSFRNAFSITSSGIADSIEMEKEERVVE